MKEQQADPDTLDLVCVHQPSVPFVRTFCERCGIDPARIVPTFARAGNTAAATLPLRLALAARQGRLRPGSELALFGLASGASAGVMPLRW
ncbi:3-oxoacyl-[acyl-carrier-protein] synthase III C-terminal domain-containing protein [Kitasatospora sp. NPDC051914]|uniref:3-oxoacyl-[acyl-carrier-protein] synthase III C-terminal domain-containing protein n=1 Tax=Kitasatospora sp. NPDC051914 TaxID=3154945 RepID=UPI003425D3F4